MVAVPAHATPVRVTARTTPQGARKQCLRRKKRHLVVLKTQKLLNEHRSFTASSPVFLLPCDHFGPKKDK